MHKADLHHSNPDLQRKLEKIFQLRRTRNAVNWNQENYLKLLQHFGNPHKHLPPVVHVAGTNGKGSIIAMLRGICEAAGIPVHCYTSPHLVHVNERIVLAGKQIDDERLEALIDEALGFIGDAPLSFFEVISAVAFKAFSEVPADILLLEVGMGGRLDCTNVIDAPLVSIISRVSMDHMQFLGDTIEEIAAQKAGIIKPGVPCVLGYHGGGEQGETVIKVVQQKAQQEGAPLFLVEQGEERFSLSLTGQHQRYNAAAVLAAIEQIRKQGFDIPEEAVVQGLQNCKWPGRLQRIDQDWPGGRAHTHEIWLDCGHNDSAGEALAAQIKLWNKEDARQTHLIVGMLGSKDSKSFLAPLREMVDSIYVVPIANDPTSQSADMIGGANAADDFKQVVETIVENAKYPVRILIAGSVYLAGEVLQFINISESR